MFIHDVVERLRSAGCVFAEDEARLLSEHTDSPAVLGELVERRVDGEPLEHLVGWAEFCGRRIAVTPGVFVPRRRTELLVREARAVLAASAVVVDLCCGSGAVAAALDVPVTVYATDVDPVAVAVARRNVPGAVLQGDLFDPLPGELRGTVDVVVANAPYVPTDALDLLPAEARLHEPPAALDGGSDGLDVVRRIAAAAPEWLAPGGHLLVESSQAQATASLLGRAFDARVARDDDLDATVVIGRLRG